MRNTTTFQLPQVAAISNAYVNNMGGTLGMTGHPLRPAKSAADLITGLNFTKRVHFRTLEDFPKREDSTNVRHKARVKVAEMIRDQYARNDFFVILQGTDSLAETTSALSMIWKQSLQKSVFVIGSQMTKDESGTDMPMQMESVMRIGRAFHRNGVVGVFTLSVGQVWDGARVRKKNESDFFSFYTPGREPVAYARPHIMLQEYLLRRVDPQRVAEGLRIDGEFEPNVMTLKVSADTPPSALTAHIGGSMKGVILEAKGAGNIPNCPWDDGESHNDSTGANDWISAIRQASEAGMHVAALSPFDDGRINLDRYELGALARDAGMYSLGSLTPDMADFKFRQAIARHDEDRKALQFFLTTDMIGEMLPGLEIEEDEPEPDVVERHIAALDNL